MILEECWFVGLNTVWADKITEVSTDRSTFAMSVNINQHGVTTQNAWIYNKSWLSETRVFSQLLFTGEETAGPKTDVFRHITQQRLIKS